MAVRHIARPFVCALFVIATAAGQAKAQTAKALSASEIERALSDAGYSPQAAEKPDGERPEFGATVSLSPDSKITFYVRTFECTGEPLACGIVNFYANFDLGHDVALDDFRTLNHFNDTHVFGRAYALEANNEVGVDLAVDLRGGAAPEHLELAVLRWPGILQAFIDNFREGPPE